jgi:hypothetical protein
MTTCTTYVVACAFFGVLLPWVCMYPGTCLPIAYRGTGDIRLPRTTFLVPSRITTSMYDVCLATLSGTIPILVVSKASLRSLRKIEMTLSSVSLKCLEHGTPDCLVLDICYEQHL